MVRSRLHLAKLFVPKEIKGRKNRREIALLIPCLAQETIKLRTVTSYGSKQGDIKAIHGITEAPISMAAIIWRSEKAQQPVMGSDISRSCKKERVLSAFPQHWDLFKSNIPF